MSLKERIKISLMEKNVTANDIAFCCLVVTVFFLLLWIPRSYDNLMSHSDTVVVYLKQQSTSCWKEKNIWVRFMENTRQQSQNVSWNAQTKYDRLVLYSAKILNCGFFLFVTMSYDVTTERVLAFRKDEQRRTERMKRRRALWCSSADLSLQTQWSLDL